MQDWNVVATVREGGYRRARELLGALGEVAATDYYNVLVLKVASPATFLDDLLELAASDADVERCVARAVPAAQTFLYQSPEDFEREAKSALAQWLPRLAGASFHVRFHRRGFKGRVSSQSEEQTLDAFLMESLAERGEEGCVSFDDPDFIVDIETVGQRAGLSLWSREERLRYALLKLD